MSIESLQKAEASQIKNLEEKTGKKLQEWIAIVQDSKLEKHGELVQMLKDKHELTHGYANMVVHWAKQSHAGAEGQETDWLAEQYKGKENLKPWYDKLMKEINKFGNDVELSPKKAYMSLRRKKQFAIIQPSTKSRLDIGLNIKNVAPTETHNDASVLEAAGNWNSMCTHRVKVEEEKTINADLIKWIKQAYDQAG